MDNPATSPTCSGYSYETMQPLEKQFAEKTTCHGLRFISDSAHVPTKLMWTIVVLTALGGLIYGISSMSWAYGAYPSYMSIQTLVSSNHWHSFH